VIPTTIQQASFTSLIVIAFVLKTLDILHLIIRQGNIDIFFMDWEKSKTGWKLPGEDLFFNNERNEFSRKSKFSFSLAIVFCSK
jgi:hypothetical protein